MADRDAPPGDGRRDSLSSGLRRSASTLRSSGHGGNVQARPAGLGASSDEGRQVGWHADPFGRFQQRWWDGTGWSEKTRSADVAAIDPPGIDVAPAHITDSAPARPIDDALLPIPRRRIADKLALLAGCLVFLALVAVLVVALTA